MKQIGTAVTLCLAVSMAGIATAQTVELNLPEAAPDDLRQAINAASLTLQLDRESDVDAQDYAAAARADYRRILTGLYAQGYYGGTISIRIDGREASGILPLDAPNQIAAIEITVEPGPQFTFGEASVTPLAEESILPEGFATGQPAQADMVRSAARTAITGWRENGYALAQVSDQQISANHLQSTLDASVQIAPGPRLTFGAVTIVGNEAVRQERLYEIAGVPEGAIFSPDELDRVRTRLRRTGAFSSVVVIEADTAGPNNTLPIEVQVAESAPRRLGFGAEYSTLDGATLSAFWLHRNLLGGAERFRVEAEVSGIVGQTGGIDYRLSTSFDRPATFRPDIDLNINATLQRLDEPDYFLDQFSLDVGFTQYESDRTTYTAGISLLRAHEETDVRSRRYTLVSLPLSMTYDRRDAPLNPSFGSYLKFEARPFADLGGNTMGARLFADGRAYYSLGSSERLTFAARVQLGSVLGTDLTDAPADYLFYSGGGGTVRGQSYQSLGLDLTRDFGSGPVTFRSGGASFAGAQLEARFDVTETIGIVGFYDIGTISTADFPSSGDVWHAGMGIGIRYNTGIGPIRLDLATPANGGNIGKRLEVYIGIGQSF